MELLRLPGGQIQSVGEGSLPVDKPAGYEELPALTLARSSPRCEAGRSASRPKPRYDRGRLSRLSRTSVVLAASLAVAGALAGAVSPSTHASAPTLAQLVGQRLVVAMTGTSPDLGLLARVRAGEVGGVILASGNIRNTE